MTNTQNMQFCLTLRCYTIMVPHKYYGTKVNKTPLLQTTGLYSSFYFHLQRYFRHVSICTWSLSGKFPIQYQKLQLSLHLHHTRHNNVTLIQLLRLKFTNSHNPFKAKQKSRLFVFHLENQENISFLFVLLFYNVKSTAKANVLKETT